MDQPRDQKHEVAQNQRNLVAEADCCWISLSMLKLFAVVGDCPALSIDILGAEECHIRLKATPARVAGYVLSTFMVLAQLRRG